MGTTRQDAWNNDEDLLLAEVVLRHVREGGTQLAAFEEVGKKLSRTSAACGFRWNSLIRKQYEAAITIAKSQRKQTMSERSAKEKSKKKQLQQEQSQNYPERIETVNRTEHSLPSFSLEDVIRYLQTMQQDKLHQNTLEMENKKLHEMIEEFKKQNDRLKVDFDQLQKNFENVNEDYRTMLNFMERARKLAVTDDSQANQVKFQMEYNGNLQKVEK
ncbi:RsfA family transcriptional regulator [Pseudalkalibacillus decolorationis]|uniref:RsfA family transcriptional regulator n=1 Tax=Pseudalkalibacillus decolorationis TaxID=163879 RepID=UPI0021495C14|nr:RsfA family transcriptional regulator [Pseudalkalibacillus decolorationis]